MISFIASFDSAALQALYTSRTPELVGFFGSVTLLGNVFFITVLALSMAFLLWRHKRLEYKAGLAVALFGSLLASYLVKMLAGRPRPPVLYHAIFEMGYSMPSMHAAVALATYGFLAYMTWKLMRPSHHRLPWIVFLSVLVLLIGFSRVYLGVHYPSDVVAGFAIGAVFLWLGTVVTKRLRNRGAS